MYRYVLVIFLLIFVITGCSSIGPGRIYTDRKSYNDIVRETDYQQLLTNIVRLSYIEPTFYLKVTNITSSYSLNSSVSATPTFTNASGSAWGLTKSLEVTPSVSYSDSPTISYIPIDDATFVAMLHRPISFDDITLIFNDGISDIEVLARLAFNRVGDLDNASSATTPKIVEKPEYMKYYRFIHLIVQLLENKLATI